MKILYLKDRIRRVFYMSLEKKLLILKYTYFNSQLPEALRARAYQEYVNLISFYSRTKIRNRCILTNRSRAVYRKFKMSRMMLKSLGLRGMLMGIKKASW